VSTQILWKNLQKLTSLTFGRFLALQPCDEVSVNGMVGFKWVGCFHFVFSVLLFLTPPVYIVIGICQQISTVLFYIFFGMAFATVQISCQTLYPSDGCGLAPPPEGRPPAHPTRGWCGIPQYKYKKKAPLARGLQHIIYKLL